MVIRKIMDKYDSIIVVVITLGLLFAVTFQVLYRFVPNLSFSWSLELITYLFSWLTWMGIGIGIQRNAHVGIDVLVDKFSKRNRFILRVLHNLGFFVFLVTLLYFGTKALHLYFLRPLSTPAMKMPYLVYRFPIVAGTLSGLFRLIQKTVYLYRDFRIDDGNWAGSGSLGSQGKRGEV